MTSLRQDVKGFSSFQSSSDGSNPNKMDTNPEQSKSPGSDKDTWTSAGSKFLGKKFGGTSRLVVSSKMWLNTIPTRDCDVLMTFPTKVEESALAWLLTRLRTRTPDLAVHVRHHSNTGVYGFYLTAEYDNLLRVAEELSIKKPMKPDYGGGMKEFVYEDQDYFENIDDATKFFTSQERQSIVQHMLFNLRATADDQLDKIKFLEGQAIVPYLLSKNVIKQVLPLHNNDDVGFLRKKWVRAFIRSQPLDKICEYFGVKIALYFAYLGHYTRALVLPALLGIVMWFSNGNSQYADDVWFVVFAFFNVIWATLYLESWKRKSAERAYQWGTLDKEDELLTEPRPLYHGYTSKSPVTGRMENVYPAWKRNIFRYFVSLPIIAICLGVVFATMWGIFELQDWINAKIKLEELPSCLKFGPKVLLALSIGILDDIYKKIAYWLNGKENYRLEETYETNLIIKLVLFQFVNSFLSLFYIAFYLRDMNRLKDQLATLLITRQVIGNIKEALIPFFVGKAKLVKLGYEMTEGLTPDTLDKQAKQMSEGNSKKTDAPTADDPHPPEDEMPSTPEAQDIFTEVFSEGKSSEDDEAGDVRRRGVRKEVKKTPEGEMEITHSGASLTQAEVEASQKAYEDTFEDYLEMLIQFGYVTLFSSAFPFAALCALLNNVIEIRSDAFKLCYTLQRPFGQRVENIGSWQHALEVMSVIAVMVNCALIGMSGLADRLFPNLGAAERIVFIVILEHFVIAFKFMLAYAIPDIPTWVAEEKARLEFLRREALKKMESKSSGSTSSQRTPSSPSKSPTGDVGKTRMSAPSALSADRAAEMLREETVRSAADSISSLTPSSPTRYGSGSYEGYLSRYSSSSTTTTSSSNGSKPDYSFRRPAPRSAGAFSSYSRPYRS